MVARRISLALVLLGGGACGLDPVEANGDVEGGSTGAVDTETGDVQVRPDDEGTSTGAPRESTGEDDGHGESSTGEPELPPPDPDPVFGAFAWPVDAWVSATDYYENGSPHSGSADLSGPYWTPVGAARAGTVIAARWTEIGGYLVRIEHEAGYWTVYSHLSEPPLVEEGDEVETNQVIGYLGRTGNAFRGGAHVHFSIVLDGERQVVPTLDFAQWVQRGQPIPGDWAELEEVEIPHATFDVRVTSGPLSVLEEPSQSGATIGELDEGEVVTVRGSHRGYYRIWDAGEEGWIVHSATSPAEANLFGVKVVFPTVPVYSEPGSGAEVVGELEAGELVTVFETMNEHHRFLYDLPTTYRWLEVGHTQPTPEFRTRIRASSVNVRTGPDIEHDVLGTLGFFEPFIVHEVRAGWYRLTYQEQEAWVAGWLTSGRL